MDLIAQESQTLATEIRDNRELAPNAIYQNFLNRRLQSSMRATRSGMLGIRAGDSKQGDVVLFRDRDQAFALFHITDTPLPTWGGGGDWEEMTAVLARGGSTVSLSSLSFVASDPRLLVSALDEATMTRLGVTPFEVSEDPSKFQDAVIVGGKDGYYVVPVGAGAKGEEPWFRLPPNVAVRHDVGEALRNHLQRRHPLLRTVGLCDLPGILANMWRLKTTQLPVVAGPRLEATVLAREITSRIHELDFDVAYTYWLSPATLAFAHIMEHKPTALFVTRAHRYDLFAEPSGRPHLAFQKEIVEAVDGVFPCSNAGTEYLRSKFPSCARKIERRYLGVPCQDHRTPASKDGVLRILSCSRVVPVKRLELLALALKSTRRRIDWTHIGNGPGLEILFRQTQELPGNVKTEFLGAQPNAQVLQYYREKPVDLFANISSSEGLPVTIMEAMSFGVPCCATDVGGSREIVNDENGRLLPSDLRAEYLTEMLECFDPNDDSRRQAALDTQRTRFSADVNYLAFAEDLLKRAQKKREIMP